MVKDWLESPASGNWLLVLDNADDHDLIYGPNRYIDYLPLTDHGSILLTTRDHKVALDFVPTCFIVTLVIRVAPFDQEETAQLFSRSFGLQESEEQSKACHELANELLGVPLALTQAISFILGNRISVGEYLALYRQNDSNKIRLLSEDFEDPVGYLTTCHPQFERLTDINGRHETLRSKIP